MDEEVGLHHLSIYPWFYHFFNARLVKPLSIQIKLQQSDVKLPELRLGRESTLMCLCAQNILKLCIQSMLDPIWCQNIRPVIIEDITTC